MKGVVTFVIVFLFAASNIHAQKKRNGDSVDVEIRLRNRTKKPITDSIMVTFDRYDRRGAGIIRKVFLPVKNKIVLVKVPPAKYYIEVSCLNPNHERFTVVSYVNKRHSNVFIYDVKLSDTFEKGLVIIPVESIDLNNLRILQMKPPAN